MAKGTGLLAVWMTVNEADDADLNAWYKQEHLPERLQIPGFQTAIRYLSLTGEPKYMAMYDLESTAVLSSDAYIDMRKNATDWTRRIGRALKQSVRNEYEMLQEWGEEPAGEPSPYILIERAGVEADEEFESLLNGKLLPAMSKVPGVTRIRSFKATVGTPKYMVYYEFDRDGVTQSEAWKQAETEGGMSELQSRLTEQASNYGSYIERAVFEDLK